MNNDDVFTWIVKHPNNYPGKHLQSQPRTYEAAKPLDPKAQFHLIIKALGQYIKENIQAGRGINYKNFGAFAFQVNTELVKPAQLSNFDITKELDNQRQERKHNHKVRPCFVPDKKFQDVLMRFPGKQQLQKPKSQNSIYQKGFNMIFCNPLPIATSCYLDKQTAESALNCFARAVTDLTQLGKNLDLVVGPIKMKINNKNLTYTYDNSFANSLNTVDYEKNMKKSLTKTNQIWNKSYEDKWNTSNLSGLIQKPEKQKSDELYEKGLTLKIMSLDLNTTEVAKNKK